MNISAWIKAIRLRTLPLAVSSIGMGAFLAAAALKFRADVFVLCTLTTIFLQILSNLANDYGDSMHGADHSERQGPARMVQSGVISISQIRTAIGLFVFLCLVTGVSLLYVAFGWNMKAFLFFLMLGFLAIGAAVAYTAGRKPYGYMGLGDFSVLLFFGIVGVLGSCYLHTEEVIWLNILPAYSCGIFAVAVLNVNNIRDIESDRTAGKFSIPVRIGRQKAIKYHWFLLFSGMGSSVLYTLLNYTGPWQWLFLLSFPLLIKNGRGVANARSSPEVDPFLKQMAISTLLFVLTFGIGILLANY